MQARAIDDTEIIITALRRPTPLSLYPGSARVLTGEDVSLRGRTSLADAAALVPGLNLTETGAGQRRITMRGIHSAGENSVLLYLDETPISGPSSATSDVSQISPDIRLFDVERVEVLRGPQGTLFGSGALGGAVRVLFAKPDVERSTGEAAVGGGVVERGQPDWAAHGTINVPLIAGRLAIRATGYDERRGGVIDNVMLGVGDVDSVRTSGGRLMARLEPAPNVDMTATFLLQRQRVRDSSAGFAALGSYRTDLAERLPFPNDLRLYSLTANLQTGPSAITLAAARYRWTMTRTIDSSRAAIAASANGTYCPLFSNVARCDAGQLAAYRDYIGSLLPLVGSQPMRVDATTAELRAVTNLSGGATLTTGLFMEKRADESRSGTYRADAATGLIAAPAVPTYLRTVSVDTNQQAVFADLNFELPGNLTLSVGGRRYSYRKRSRGEVLQTSYVNGSVAGPAIFRSERSSGWTGRVNLAWQVDPNLLLFVQAASGFRPGGVNSVPNLPDQLIAFRSDSALSFEGGARWSRAGASLSGSIFGTDWSDMQASARVPSFIFVSNSGAARIVGADIEGSVGLVEGLNLRGAVNLLDARLTRDQSNPVVVAPGRRGDRIPFEPSARAALGLNGEGSLGLGTLGSAGLDLSYVGRSFSEYRPESPLNERMGDYVDLSLRFGIERGQWSGRITVENFLNGAGRRRVESFSNVERLTYALRPRTVSVDLTWRFGDLKKVRHTR